MQPTTVKSTNQKMKLVMAKTLWGVEGSGDDHQWDSMFTRIASEGYSMVECVSIFSYGGDAQFFRDLADKHNLGIIVQIHTSGGYFHDSEYVYCGSFQLEDHLRSVEKEIDIALQVKPAFINCHGGVDAWDHETQVQFLLGAMDIAKRKNVKIMFETHRQRIFCNPFQTRDLLRDDRLKDHPDLNLTADLSHWIVSCERQLHATNNSTTRDPWWPELLEQVAQRTTLIHCRIGHPQGPQVPDVTDPLYHADVRAHLDMWTTIWNVLRKKETMAEMVCEVEHGPPPYLVTLPHTNQPVADLWKVNNDVAALVRKEFAKSK